MGLASEKLFWPLVRTVVVKQNDRGELSMELGNRKNEVNVDVSFKFSYKGKRIISEDSKEAKENIESTRIISHIRNTFLSFTKLDE